MEKLTQAAQRLRESIQALAQKPVGKERDQAMQLARAALLETQQAMVDLPPEMRSQGTVSTVGYDESVKKMMKAADALRESVQAMAQREAGPDRNKAIQAADQALLETQAAMVNAYAATSTAATSGGNPGATTMGAGSGSGATTDAGATAKPANAGPATGAK